MFSHTWVVQYKHSKNSEIRKRGFLADGWSLKTIRVLFLATLE